MSDGLSDGLSDMIRRKELSIDDEAPSVSYQNFRVYYGELVKLRDKSLHEAMDASMDIATAHLGFARGLSVILKKMEQAFK